MSLATALKEQLAKHAAAHPAKKAQAKKKVHRFTIEPADDDSGYSVETHFKNDNKMGHYIEPHKSVHKNLSSVLKHMKEVSGEA